MEGFFDLREFVITLLKKIKFIIVFTLIISVLWGVARFVPLAIEYITYEDPSATEQEPVQEETVTDQPYRYQAKKIVHITAFEQSNTQMAIAHAEPMEQIEEIASAYLVYARNKAFLQPLANEFFTESKQIDAIYKEKMVEYNYRTKVVLSEEFLVQDFYNQISLETVGNSFVQISVITGSKELSEKMIIKAEAVLSEIILNEIGKFNYTVIDVPTSLSLPTPTSGLTPKTPASTANVVAGTRPTIRYMIVQTVKGCVWGLIVGFILSVVFVLMFDVMSTTVKTQKDIDKYKLRLLGTCKKNKKRRFCFIDRFIDKLEGNIQPPKSIEASCEFIKENLEVSLDKSRENTILLTGCTDLGVLESYACALKKLFEAETQITFDYSACIATESKTFHKAKQSTGVILIEEIDKSGNKEVAYEVETFRALNKDILGFVLMK